MSINGKSNHIKETEQRKEIRRNDNQPVAFAFKRHIAAGIVAFYAYAGHFVQRQQGKKACVISWATISIFDLTDESIMLREIKTGKPAEQSHILQIGKLEIIEGLNIRRQ